MKLISMTDFVLESTEQKTFKHTLLQIRDYANFLKQPLKLEMFIPCDEDGNFLEEPIDTIGGVEMYSEKYQQAKERVLFEGFDEDSADILIYYNNNIEHIIYNNIKLTKNATKQFL